MLHNLQSMHVSLLSLQMAISADVTNNVRRLSFHEHRERERERLTHHALLHYLISVAQEVWCIGNHHHAPTVDH